MYVGSRHDPFCTFSTYFGLCLAASCPCLVYFGHRLHFAAARIPSRLKFSRCYPFTPYTLVTPPSTLPSTSYHTSLLRTTRRSLGVQIRNSDLFNWCKLTLFETAPLCCKTNTISELHTDFATSAQITYHLPPSFWLASRCFLSVLSVFWPPRLLNFAAVRTLFHNCILFSQQTLKSRIITLKIISDAFGKFSTSNI